MPGEVAEAVPGGVGDGVELRAGGELEIENEKGEVSIPEQEVGAAEGFLGLMTTNPEEAGASFSPVRDRIEGIAGVDEGDSLGGEEELGKKKGERRVGTGRGEFGEGSFGEGGKGGPEGLGFAGGGLMGTRESLPKMLSKLLDL